MARSLEERVSAIEAQLAGKILEEHFRAQAELIDTRFAARDVRLGRLERDVSDVKAHVRSLRTDVSALKRDMVIVREGVSSLLKKQN